MIPGDLLSAFPHRQFHTLPGLLDSQAALSNSNPNARVPMQGGSLYHFYDGLWLPDREANSRPTVREADTLPTEPTRHGLWLCLQHGFIVGPDNVGLCYSLWMCLTLIDQQKVNGVAYESWQFNMD